MTWSRLYDFQPGTTISSSQVDDEFNQLIAIVNTLDGTDTNIKASAQMTKITTNDGGVKLSVSDKTKDFLAELLALGKGLHTFYAVSGAKNNPSTQSIRGIAHITSEGYAWVLAFDLNKNMYVNYQDNGSWKGWNPPKQNILWEGNVYPYDTDTIKPSKKLSECQHGWVLVWSDYVVGSGSRDLEWYTTLIPKSFAGFDKGGGFIEQIPTSLGTGDGTGKVATKYLYINDGDITGGTINSTGENRLAVLRKVIEI